MEVLGNVMGQKLVVDIVIGNSCARTGQMERNEALKAGHGGKCRFVSPHLQAIFFMPVAAAPWSLTVPTTVPALG
jgi:hypothetical protein